MACRRQWTAGAKARQAGRRKDENAHPETMDCPERKRVRPGAARMKMDCRRQWAAGAKARQAGRRNWMKMAGAETVDSAGARSADQARRRRKDENAHPETMDCPERKRALVAPAPGKNTTAKGLYLKLSGRIRSGVARR